MQAPISAVLFVSLTMVFVCKVHGQEIQEFKTYADVLGTLLDPSGASDFETGSVQTCGLFADSENFDPVTEPLTEAQLQSLGPNLRRHCDTFEPSNSAVGSILSGGLSSFQSTRTVSQFTLRRRSTTSQLKTKNGSSDLDESSAKPLELMGSRNSGALLKMLSASVAAVDGLSQSHYQFFNRIALESVNNEVTEFSSESDVVKALGQFGVIKEITDRYSVGATLDLSISDGSSDNILDSRCDLASSGQEDGYSAGISILQTLLLNDYISISTNLEGATFEDTYKRSLCLLTEESDIFFPDPNDENNQPTTISERFEGVITGKPSGLKLKASVEVRGSFPVGAFIANPLLGFTGSETSIDRYSESDSGNTGATLQYDARDVSSRVAQWGLSVGLPISSRRGIVSPFIDVTGFREHGDGQQRLVAQFSEDNRDVPTRFSFLSSPIDRDYGIAAIGVDWYYRSGAVGKIKLQSLFGNEFSDAVQLEARLAISF